MMADLLEQKHEFFQLIFSSFVDQNQLLFANLRNQIALAIQPPPVQQPLIDLGNYDQNEEQKQEYSEHEMQFNQFFSEQRDYDQQSYDYSQQSYYQEQQYQYVPAE